MNYIAQCHKLFLFQSPIGVILKNIFKCFILGLFLVLLSSCENDNKQKIFAESTLMKYKVRTSINNIAVDSSTIELFVPETSVFDFSFGQTRIEYRYLNANDTLIEKTGVIENEHRIYLHPPRESFMKFTELAPHPQINFPIQKGSFYLIDLLVGPGFGEYTGLKLKQKISVVEKADSLWVFEGINLSESSVIKSYQIRYWFNSNLGFVKLLYLCPDNKSIEMTKM